MGRVLAVVDRTDLSFYPGWDGCYVDWRPATYLEQQKIMRAQLSGIDDDAAEQIALGIVRDRIIGGKVMILGEERKPELVDITDEDVNTLPSVMVDRILKDMLGVQYDADPLEKTPTETTSSGLSSDDKPQTTTSTTETPSSEE